MMPLKGKIVFAGGGTGGHVYPALASIESLRQRGEFDVLYVGGYQGIENQIIPPLQIPFHRIWISGFQRYFTLRNMLFPLKLLVSLWQSFVLLRRYRPDVVVGTGGYVSGPIIYMASRLNMPTLIQEQDSYPGVTTRLLARYSDVICVPLPEVVQHLEKSSARVVVSGVPVRRSLQFREKAAVAVKWQMDPGRPVIFVFGGSQGARALNREMAEIIPVLQEKYHAQVLWQTGRAHYQEIKSLPVAARPGVNVKDYIDSMDSAYSLADIIISRAGAITLAELSLVRKPCILVPYPFAAANHQLKNAEAVARYGAAIVVTEGKEFQKDLLGAIESLLHDPEAARRMGENWRSVARPGAADQIADEIINLMEKNDKDPAGKN